MNTSTMSSSNRKPSAWQIAVLYVLGGAFIAGGVMQCFTQALADGFWPVPFGIALLVVGAFLWSLGTRARLRLADRREAA
jgi:hypothetical protein